jgi:hypothetical protein
MVGIRRPTTLFKDVKQYRTDLSALDSLLMNETLRQNEYDTLKWQLDRIYDNRLNLQDIYLFETVDILTEFLITHGLPIDDIQHEKGHAKPYEEKGYIIQYGAQFGIQDDGKVGMQLFIQGIVPADKSLYEKSLRNPKNMSPGDQGLNNNLSRYQ